MIIACRNDIRLGREKEGDSASTSARQRAPDREERWGKGNNASGGQGNTDTVLFIQNTN